MAGIRIGMVFSIVCAVLWPALANAGPKVAVLEAVGPPQTPTPRLMSWTDAVRGVVLAQVPSSFIVLTRSNIESFLPPGVDLADCEGECEITTARKIGAEYVVGVRVMAEGPTRTITVGLHAAIDGRLLGQGRVSVPAAQLEDGLRAAAEQATAIWSPAAKDVAPTDAAVKVVHPKPLTWMGAPIVKIDSTHGATISTRGRRVGHTPLNILLEGQKSIQVRAEAPGYRAQTFDIQTGGRSGQIVLDLMRNDAQIEFDVPLDDIEVHVDGSQALRGRSHTVEAGRRQFQIMHPCLKADAISIDIEAGSTQTIAVPHVLLCGRVMLTSPTAGAQVRWAGRWRDLPFISVPQPPADVDSANDASQTRPRSEKVVVRALGHRQVTQTILIPEAGTEVTEIVLTPDWVDVTVEAKHWTGKDCPGELLVDGEKTGTVRWAGRLMAGAHTFEARCGHRSRVTKTRVQLEGPTQKIVLQQRGPQTETGFAMDRLTGYTGTLRWWSAPRLPGGLRVGIGLAVGLIAAEETAAMYGLELGMGLPLTTWLEVAGFANGFVAARSCPDEGAGDDDQNNCDFGYANARAMLRVDVGGVLLDAGWGWSVHGEDSEAPRWGQGLQFGLGWTH